MAKSKQSVDLTVLPASTYSAFVEGWEIANRREIARSKAPMKIDMSKARMKMSDGGQYAVGKGINAPVDPVSGVPIVGG